LSATVFGGIRPGTLAAFADSGVHYGRATTVGQHGAVDRDRLISGLVWLCAGGWAVFAFVRLFGLERGFPLVPLFAFTPWIALGAVVPVALAAALRRWYALGTAVVAAVVLAALVLPRAFGGPTTAEGGPGATLRVLSSNVEFGEADPDELLGLARELDVDVLVVAELTPRFAAELRQAGVSEILPYEVLSAEPHARGTGVYSDLRPSQQVIQDMPGGYSLVRAHLAPSRGRPLEMIAAHIAPPIQSGTDDWTDDLEAVPAPAPEAPTVVAGDFNATLDHAEFRDVLDRGYADAADTLGEGLTATWPADRRFPPLVGIDHVLADERIGFREFSAHDVAGTDHLAIYAELDLPATGR
jgi:endonuclease/exonuclease/phosphatase family metal-dependent hydrolase